MNKVLYARKGVRSMMDRTLADYPWQVRVDVDGVDVEVPEVGIYSCERRENWVMFRGMVSLCKIFKLVHWHLVLMGQWKLLPGFSSKVRTVGKRNSEHSVDKGKGNHRDVMNSGVDRERLHIGERSSGAGGLVNQLDDPGPLRGSNLLSVSATDVEESMMALHAMDKLKTRSNGVDARELDELEEHVDNLLLEDGTCENNDIKNGPKSRDKLYMAPVTHPDRYADSIDFWRNVYGIDSAV